MMGYELEQLFKWADKLGTLACFIIFAVGILRKWWVPGWVLEDCQKRETEWKSTALSGLPITRQAVQTAQEVVTILRTKDGS